MFNVDLRSAIHKAGFHGYEVAQAMGISECYFSRKLSRSELSCEEKQKVFDAIDRLYQSRLKELFANPIGGDSQ